MPKLASGVSDIARWGTGAPPPGMQGVAFNVGGLGEALLALQTLDKARQRATCRPFLANSGVYTRRGNLQHFIMIGGRHQSGPVC